MSFPVFGVADNICNHTNSRMSQHNGLQTERLTQSAADVTMAHMLTGYGMNPLWQGIEQRCVHPESNAFRPHLAPKKATRYSVEEAKHEGSYNLFVHATSLLAVNTGPARNAKLDLLSSPRARCGAAKEKERRAHLEFSTATPNPVAFSIVGNFFKNQGQLRVFCCLLQWSNCLLPALLF